MVLLKADIGPRSNRLKKSRIFTTVTISTAFSTMIITIMTTIPIPSLAV